MKKFIIIGFSILIFLVLGFTVKATSYPPDDTRIILEHTHQVYIAPPCFEEANPTNNVDETTLEKAKQTDYEIQAPCTEKMLAGVREPIFINWFKKIGLLKSTNWDW